MDVRSVIWTAGILRTRAPGRYSQQIREALRPYLSTKDDSVRVSIIRQFLAAGSPADSVIDELSTDDLFLHFRQSSVLRTVLAVPHGAERVALLMNSAGVGRVLQVAQLLRMGPGSSNALLVRETEAALRRHLMDKRANVRVEVVQALMAMNAVFPEAVNVLESLLSESNLEPNLRCTVAVLLGNLGCHSLSIVSALRESFAKGSDRIVLISALRLHLLGLLEPEEISRRLKLPQETDLLSVADELLALLPEEECSQLLIERIAPAGGPALETYLDALRKQSLTEEGVQLLLELVRPRQGEQADAQRVRRMLFNRLTTGRFQDEDDIPF